jgi:hypothetical protein
MTELTVIRPEIVAGKLAAAANLSQPHLAKEFKDQPRLVELMWFLQSRSMMPGGLGKFSIDLIEQHANRIGPASLLKTNPARLTPAQCLEIWNEIPFGNREDIVPEKAYRIASLHQCSDDLFTVFPEEEKKHQAAVRKLSRQQFSQAAARAARAHLCQYLASLCTDIQRPGVIRDVVAAHAFNRPPWFFEDIIPTLFAAMDAHAKTASQNIAMTEVALKVFDGLDYAWSEKSLSQITGDSRFGKTEAVKTWCEMYPGRARLVSTPFSNVAADLYRSVADAIGIEHDYKTNPRKLRELVEFTVKHSGLMFVFDESHFLFPTSFSQNTVPMRLNWLRTQMVDRKVPVALVSTPQAYNHALAKFTKATSYNITQWSGRIVRQVRLPAELAFSDLLAIAKLKCPELHRDLQELIAAKALQSENYIMSVEAIGKLARHIAHRDGHRSIRLEDVTLAAAEVIPTWAMVQATPVKSAPDKVAPHQRQNPVAVKRGRAITPAAPPAALEMDNPRQVVRNESAAPLEMPARQTTPALHPV